METSTSPESLFSRLRKAEYLLVDAAKGFLRDPSDSLESLYRLVILSSVWTWVNDFHERGQNIYEEITFVAKHFATEVSRQGEIDGINVQARLGMLSGLVGEFAETTVRLACRQVVYEPRYASAPDYYELILRGMPVTFHEGIELAAEGDDQQPVSMPISA